MKPSASVRQRILDAALDIVEAHGIKALTQPRIAKAIGLRQSHLTYYFPRKADLFVALLQSSHDRAARNFALLGEAKNLDPGMEGLKGLLSDRHRMRFFLGIILEASEDPELLAIVAAHAHKLVEQVAAEFGRSTDDPNVIAFIDLFRGIGLRLLLEPEQSGNVPDLEALAAGFGLSKKPPAPVKRKRKA